MLNNNWSGFTGFRCFGALRRGNGGDPQTLDPSSAEDVHAFNALRDLYEGLIVEAAVA